MADSTDSQAPAEPTTPEPASTAAPEVASTAAPEGAPAPTEVPSEPAPASTSAPADSTPVNEGSAADAPAEAPSAPEAPAPEQPSQAPEAPAEVPAEAPKVMDTTAGNVPFNDTVTATPVSTNPNAPAPATVVKQKTIQELEDELDSGEVKSIEDFVKGHWDAQDANAQRLAQVLKMDVVEIWAILKELGVKLSEGM
jgi:hypothetical protein